MRYSGIQPQYFPRLHYFSRILHTDIFMIRDDVQFVRKHKYPDGTTNKSFQADTPIKQSNGQYLLHVPTKHNGFIQIGQTLIDYMHEWQKDHLKAIQYTYSKAENFKKVYPQLETVLGRRYKNLAELNIATIIWGLLYLLGENRITKDVISRAYAEALLSKQKRFRLKKIKKGTESTALKRDGLDANEKIVALCKEIGADEDYCGGTGMAAYVDTDYFAKNGISLRVQDWKCQEYPQLFMKHLGFVPNLSIIDLLMNVPRKRAVEILMG